MARGAWVIGVGSPGILLLNAWGDAVRRVFDETPYLVGSASMGKQWRDVDVRVILDDSEWERWFGRCERPFQFNARWSGICLAFSLWGQKVTGLPVDFQVQQASDEERQNYTGNRVPLGIYPYPQPWQPKQTVAPAQALSPLSGNTSQQAPDLSTLPEDGPAA